MPFASPFGSVTTPSFNPGYSNVPQNKAATPAAIAQKKAAAPEDTTPMGTTSSVAELTAGVTPKIFTPQEAAVPPPAEFAPARMPSLPPYSQMVVPPPFNPYYLSEVVPGMGVPARVEAPQLPQRINPNRPIFV